MERPVLKSRSKGYLGRGRKAAAMLAAIMVFAGGDVCAAAGGSTG